MSSALAWTISSSVTKFFFERISSMVGSVLGNNTQIRLNEHPEGKELTTILDATLDIHLNSLIEVNQNVR